VRQYIITRLSLLIPVLFFVSVLVFALARVIPGDAAILKAMGSPEGDAAGEIIGELRRQFGLDKPYPVQYVEWLGKVLQGDMSTSFWTQKPVLEEIVSRLDVTFELAIGTTIVSVLIAIPAGVISAIRRDTGLDYVARITSILGLAMPNFWIGTLMIVLPAFWWGYVPPPGYTPMAQDPWRNFQQFIFPSLAMGTSFSAIAMRMTRSQMLEVLRQDYIRTAFAKGLRERVVVYRHALRNAVIPVMTIVGIQFGHLLGRTVIMETVFALPGLGTMTLRAIQQRDYPLIQGSVLVMALMFLLVNFVVDILYAVVDPRIRYQ